MNSISLVLATVNRTLEVGRFVRSLVAQSASTFELIIVDQNKDDRLLPYIKDGRNLGLQIKHLRLEQPSLSGARNLGLQHASGSIVAFPDDDCWYEYDVVEKSCAAFAAADTTGGIIGCWVEQATARQEYQPATAISYEAWRNFRGRDASSISLFLKRDLFMSLGGFDERFGVGQWFGAAEETDLVLRALVRGATLVRNPTIRVHHHFLSTPLARTAADYRSARSRARGTGGIYAKHHLGLWIVLRGILAPIFKPLMRGHIASAGQGAFVSLGRAEGFFHWKRTHSK